MAITAAGLLKWQGKTEYCNMRIKYSVLGAGLSAMRGLYALMKIRNIKNRITIISRQSDTPSVDICLIKEYLDKNHPEIECRIMTKSIKSGFSEKVSYVFHILDQMRSIAVSRVVIIDGYCIAASVLKHRRGTKIIQMWHAMAAIKKFGYQTLDKESGHSSRLSEIMCMHKNYDFILCPSEETGRIFCMGFNSDPDKLRLLALPRIDYILDTADEKTIKLRQMLKDKAGDRKTILYAPTFRNNDTVRLEELCNAIDFERYLLVVSPHPLDIDNYRGAASCQDMDNLIIDSATDSFSWIKACDIIITDYSALGIEALVTEKPIYYYVYDIDTYIEEVGLNINVLEDMPNCTSRDAAELMDMVSKEYNYTEFRAFKNKYITADINNCTQKLAEFAVGLCVQSR